MSITALKLLKSAAAKGWTFKVYGPDEPDYVGASAVKAWEAVKATEEANVGFFADGKRLGVAYLMAPSAMTCSDEETLVDYSCAEEGSPKNEFELLCDAMIEETF